ncbi:MAG TPA: FecR domain-containing protein [Caulobacteraceae bacterium]|nr:FecR domain-containing protein [Caulobacteraceae bacterium]
MTQRETSAAIDDAAAAWLARLDRAPLIGPEADALEAWLAADPRRRGAFARARAVMVYTDRARTLLDRSDAKGRDGFVRQGAYSRVTRRGTLVAGGAVAATVLVGVISLGFGFWLPGRAYETQKGEVRRLPLADGSVLTLNTATKVDVKFSAARRDIQLVEGEAVFDVAKNAKRPFYVDSGDLRVRAVGTSFTVRKWPGKPTQVLVSEGVVEVSRAGSKPIRVSANQQAQVNADASLSSTAVDADALTRELMWRQGMISFEASTLRDAALQFSRYSDTRIEIDDPVVADKTISGLFSATNPAGFARAVALSLNLNTRTEGDTIRLSR